MPWKEEPFWNFRELQRFRWKQECLNNTVGFMIPAAEAGEHRVETPSASSGADKIVAFVFNLKQKSSRLELYFFFPFGNTDPGRKEQKFH